MTGNDEREHFMNEAQEIAGRWNFALGKLPHDARPYFVACDGHILHRFSTATERANWLEDYNRDTQLIRTRRLVK